MLTTIQLKMGYIEKLLIQNEKIIYTTKISWTAFLKPILVLLVGIYFQMNVYLGEPIGILIILGGIAWLILTLISSKFSEFAVTDKRIFIKTGFIKTNSLEIMLHKIEGIFVEQGMIGKIFNSGTIVIKGTGGTGSPFSNIDAPYDFRNAVNEEIEKKR